MRILSQSNITLTAGFFESVKQTWMFQNKYRCPECSKEYRRFGQFRGHVKSHREKPHKCDLCDAGFELQSNLVLHRALHNVSNPACPECGKKFSRMSSLKAHLMFHEKSEDSEPLFSECDESDESDPDNSKQNELVILEKVYECKQCPMKFDDAASLNWHRKIHHQFKVALSVKQHRRSRSEMNESGFQHRCLACGKKFQKMCQLSRHILTHTGERPFKCDMCEKAFNQKNALDAHKTAMHNTDRPHKCNFCPFACSLKGNLRKHIMSAHSGELETGEVLFCCDYCSCSFRKSYALNTHVLKMHTNYFSKQKTSELQQEDEMCEVESELTNEVSDVKEQQKNAPRTRRQLEMQLTVVLEKTDDCSFSQTNGWSEGDSGENELKDSDYGQDFTNVTLQQESPDPEVIFKCMPERYKALAGENSHAFEKYIFREDDGVHFYGCTYCSKEYRSLRTLVTHICPNIPQKLYKCMQCPVTFSSKSSLESHKKVHFETKDVKCDVCDKNFVDEETLKIHSFIHPKYKAYKCSVCGEAFPTSKQRRSHFISQCKIPAPKVLNKNTPTPDVPFKESSVIFDLSSFKPSSDHLFHENSISPETAACKDVLDCEMDNCVQLDGPVNCLWCNKVFFSNEAYNFHLVAHASVNRFKCKLCDAAFFTEALLKDHVNSHEVKPSFYKTLSSVV